MSSEVFYAWETAELVALSSMMRGRSCACGFGSTCEVVGELCCDRCGPVKANAWCQPVQQTAWKKHAERYNYLLEKGPRMPPGLPRQEGSSAANALFEELTATRRELTRATEQVKAYETLVDTLTASLRRCSPSGE